ncbi:MAG: phytoene/squalene synthase family protein [Polyangiaceae bacterium]|nr:phytoene/squalene synthase family protein [Polyangiaceae bacterium]
MRQISSDRPDFAIAPGVDEGSPDIDLDACRDLLRKGSKSFSAAALLLPERVRGGATALYAFCRVADDAIDEAHGDVGEALDSLHKRLDAAYRGTPEDHPVDRAFSRAAAEHGIPRALMDALLEGFAWDAEGRRYETLSDVRAYSARVAAAVGAMMTVIMGRRDAPVLARACDLGVAMQLTNIARDVGEDARAGRLYLPLAWLEEAGIDPDGWLSKPAMSPAIGAMVERLLASAEELYRRAEGGIAMLPFDCRPSIFAARFIYAEIGREIERAGFDSVSRRAFVPLRTKLFLLAKAVGEAASTWSAEELGDTPARREPVDALPETQFLVEAAAL